MKKLTSLLAILLALTLLLAACGGKTDSGKDSGKDKEENKEDNKEDNKEEDKDTEYPALELPDISGVSLTDGEGNGAAFSYPSDKWTLADGQLYLNETIEDNAKANASVRFEAASTELTEKDMKELKDALLTEEMSFMNFNAAEFRSVDGGKAAYIDIVISDKEAYIDFIIDFAGLTDEMLEQAGGRDGILEAMPATNQLAIYFNNGGDLYSLSGVYFTESQKNDLLELFAAVYGSIKKA